MRMKKLLFLSLFVLCLPMVLAGRLDNLNIVEESFIFTIDTILPVVQNITPINGTLTNTAVNFTGNVTEVNPLTLQLWINTTGIWHLNRTVNYTNNVPVNFSSFTLPDGNFIWSVCANDSAGNVGCFGHNYSITMDTTAPVMTLNLPILNSKDDIQPTVFNTTISDLSPMNCTTFLDGTIISFDNLTTSTDLFFTNTTTQATHIYNVTCLDTFSLQSSVSTSFIKVITKSGDQGGGSTPVTQPLAIINLSAGVIEAEVVELTAIQQFLNTIREFFGFGTQQTSIETGGTTQQGGLQPFSLGSSTIQSTFDLPLDVRMAMIIFVSVLVVAIAGYFLLVLMGFFRRV